MTSFTSLRLGAFLTQIISLALRTCQNVVGLASVCKIVCFSRVAGRAIQGSMVAWDELEIYSAINAPERYSCTSTAAPIDPCLSNAKPSSTYVVQLSSYGIGPLFCSFRGDTSSLLGDNYLKKRKGAQNACWYTQIHCLSKQIWWFHT